MHRDVIKRILMLMSHMLKLLHWIIARMLECTLKASTQIHEKMVGMISEGCEIIRVIVSILFIPEIVEVLQIHMCGC